LTFADFVAFGDVLAKTFLREALVFPGVFLAPFRLIPEYEPNSNAGFHYFGG